MQSDVLVVVRNCVLNIGYVLKDIAIAIVMTDTVCVSNSFPGLCLIWHSPGLMHCIRKKGTMKKSRIKIILICLGIFILGACTKQKDNQEFVWNQINTDITLGNSSANHANRGLICGKDGWIYFSDYNYEGHLCRALPDGSNKEVLLEEHCCNLNVIDDCLYYQSEKDHSIRSYNLLNHTLTILVEDAVDDMVVTSEAIYFITDTIEKINLDGTGRTELLEKGEYLYLDVYGDYLFYTTLTDGIDLYTISSEGKQNTLLLDEAKGAVVIEDNIYYTGVEDNLLYCYDAKEQAMKQIDKGYNVNVWQDKIYYIKEKQLCCYQNGQSSNILSEFFAEYIDKSEIENYYIHSDFMYIIYSICIDGVDSTQLISYHLVSGQITLL